MSTEVAPMPQYIPSPRDWVREQVELYESSGGTRGTTLRDTGLPVIIVTNIGNKTGAIRKTPLMRVRDGTITSSSGHRAARRKIQSGFTIFAPIRRLNCATKRSCDECGCARLRAKLNGTGFGSSPLPRIRLMQIPGAHHPTDPHLRCRTMRRGLIHAAWPGKPIYIRNV